MSIDLLSSPKDEKIQELEDYRQCSAEELRQRILEAKRQLGDRLLILGHHYQKDEVIELADLRGDSFKLSQQAAESRRAKYIIFCGVHFMAETADILTDESVQVILPDLAAGCSMADMADSDGVEACWDDLAQLIDVEDITPVTYINSTADLKSFCGQHGGVVCTSSNVQTVLEWAFSERSRVLFFPDQHLGRNTAKGMGIPLDRMLVWDPNLPLGGNSPEVVHAAKVLLWNGWCSVHQIFRTEHIKMFRQKDPETKILVHPECMMEVVDQADLVGSTEFIIQTVRGAPAGSRWAIGTELHLVHRLKEEHPEQQIHFLSSMVCMCATMYRIDLPHLCWTIEQLVKGKVVNRIRVSPEVRRWSRVALERMLRLRTG